MHSRLQSWKANLLNKAGRHTLVQTTLSTIPLYTMQTCWLPSGVCSEIDRLCRNFLWDSMENRKGIHLLNWESVCSLKSMGVSVYVWRGRIILPCLESCFGPWFSKEGQPWVQVLGGKYCVGSLVLDSRAYSAASPCWRAIQHAMPYFRDGFAWRIGNGRQVSFWYDRWVGDTSLRYLVSNIDEHDQNLKVADVLSDFHAWNLSTLRTHLPGEVVASIQAVPLPRSLDFQDILIWGESTTGKYSVKPGFEFLSRVPYPPDPRKCWLRLWKLPIPQKFKFFL